MTAARDLSKLGNQNAIKVDTTNTRLGVNSTSPDSTLDVGGEIIVGSGASINTAGEAVFVGVVTAVGLNVTGSDITGVGTQGIDIAARGLVIAGVSTFYGTSSFADDVKVTAGGLDVVGVITSNNKVVATGLDIGTAGVDIDGQTDLDELVVAGVSTFSAKSVFNTAYPSIDADNEIQVGTAIQLGKAGVVTATTFVGNVTGDLTGDINATTLDTTTSGAVVTGIVTASAGADLNGFKTEEGVYDTTALNGEFDFEFENGHVQTHTGSTAGTYFPDFRVSSSTSLDSVMGVGDVVSCTLIVAASNTAHYCTTGIKIDNSTSNVTIEWIGSAAPTAGKGAGYDIYAFTIQKTAATPAYLVIVNATDAG